MLPGALWIVPGIRVARWCSFGFIARFFGSDSFSPDFLMEFWPPLFPVKENNLED